jgi:hypothetical protein
VLQLAPGERASVRLGDVLTAPLVAALVDVEGGPAAVEHEVRGPHGRDAGPCASAASATWHLATGATTRDARDLLVLFNPFPTDAIVDGVFESEDGTREPVRFQGLPVPALSVVGVDIGDDVRRKENVAATLRVRSGQVVAERIQQIDGSLGREGLSLALGAPSAATAWAFADGGTGAGRAEQIVVYNPGDRRAEVEVRVFPTTEDGATRPQPFHVSVRARGFEVVDLGAEARVPAGVGHATLVLATNGVPVVAERLAAAQADATRDTATTPGSILAATHWTFTTPATSGGAEARIVVFNPDGERAARVTLTATIGGRARTRPDTSNVRVPPGGRVELPVPRLGNVAPVLDADGPVVAERVVASADGATLSASAGLPGLDGARALVELVAAGQLAGAAP